MKQLKKNTYKCVKLKLNIIASFFYFCFASAHRPLSLRLRWFCDSLGDILSPKTPMLVNAIISNGGFPPLVYQNTKGLIVCMSSSLGRREKVLPKVVVGEHEYMVAMKNCADAGFSVFAHYIRHLVCGTNAPNFKRKCKKVVRKVITKKMTEMEEKELNQLIGIANNLNQLARACNRSKMKGNPIDSVIIYVTIAEIEEALSIYMSNRQEKKNDN